jgi:hypothetical protein
LRGGFVLALFSNLDNYSKRVVPCRPNAVGGSTIAFGRLSHFFKPKNIFFFLALFFLLPQPTLAQYLGSVSIQTVQQNLFAAGTVCTGAPQTATVNNLGQTSHTVVLLQGATATSIKFFLEGSNDGANFTRISDEYDGIQSGALQASGYYTVVRANVTCSPGTATFGMTYSGSGVPPSQPQGDGLRSQVEKVIAQAISTTGNQNFGLRSPYGNTAGLLQFTTSGGTFSGAAAVTVTCTLLSGQSTTVLNSTALSGATQLITVPASPCVSLVIGYTQGTSTGNMTIEYVFSAGFAGAGGIGASGTGGCVADGTAPCNPLVVAGVTSPGSSVPGVTRYVTALAENANDLSVGNLNVRGLAIGAGNINPQGQTTGTTLPNIGPIGAAVTGVRTDLSTGTNNPLSSTPAAGFSYGVNSQGAANNSGPGLLTNQNGFSILTTATSVTANGNQNVTNFPAWDVGTFDACYVTVTTGTPTGTAPTLDVHFQSSTDGTNFTDRIHFTQITTTASTQKQVAGIVTGIGGITPTAISNGLELAAGSILNGPIGAWLRFQFVIGGSASPTFPTTQFGVVCH